MNFKPWPKIPRFSRDIVVTEKLDGTNSSVTIVPILQMEGGTDGSLGLFDGFCVFAGSRTRWIQPGKNTDNYGFAAWALANVAELLKLGPGSHFGEFWGAGIQRRYGLTEKRFSLFNVARWGGCPQNGWKGLVDLQTGALGPACCSVVPKLYEGPFDQEKIEERILILQGQGSVAAPGFMDPEGIVIYHTASGQLFKKTCRDDAKAKGQA